MSSFVCMWDIKLFEIPKLHFLLFSCTNEEVVTKHNINVVCRKDISPRS